MAENNVSTVAMSNLVPNYLDKTPKVPKLLDPTEADYSVSVGTTGADTGKILVVPAIGAFD